jgi:predicted RNA-binding protein with EMAP domain
MDKLKEKINEIVKKVKEDKDFANNFKSDPIKAVESVIGIDLPDGEINKVVDAVKAKLTADNAKDAVNKLKGLFK